MQTTWTPHRPVVVTGLMGAGKTTLGARLAALWSLPLHDSDAWLLAKTGLSAREIRDERGTGGLHELEAEHLLSHLITGAGCVIAAAASTIDRPDCRAALRTSALTIWIDVPPADLVHRQQIGGYRPQFGDDLAAMLLDMDRRRRPLFAQTAQVVVTPPPEGGSPVATDHFIEDLADRVRQLDLEGTGA